MGRIRIYKVAELLDITSQEVLSLLKRNHGIELKSASSTIEEVVARQFVKREAKSRKIAQPTGDMFAAKESAPKKKRASKAKKKTEPPKKPDKPSLGPPRLVKTIKPAPPPTEATETPEEITTSVEAAVAPHEEPVTTTSDPEDTAPGRVAPSTIRLRIEEPGSPVRPAARTKRAAVLKKRRTQKQATPTQTPKAEKLKTTSPTKSRPSSRVLPPRPRPTTPSMMGGPRPLPAQPVRTQQPQGPPPRRPGMPSRPMFQRPRPVQGRKRTRPSAPAMPTGPTTPPPISRTVTLAEGMTVKDLAEKLEVRVKDVLTKLLMKRMMLTINSTLDTETARDIAREFGADIEIRSFEEDLLHTETEESEPKDLSPRAPVVTVMGHVDHGKTSLLDAIRETRVAEREAGGITQHIGAYNVDVSGRSIVFLDTPGHEAFTLMRARGAKVTDIVVLVVAADDGVMPQTKEAIDHAKAANVPLVVAINKTDKPGANPDNVKRELAELDLVPEDWGGQTVTVPVSAKKHENLDQLLEMILLSSDILELKANAKRLASGTVLEAKIDRGRGPVATVIVLDGTLNVGDNFIAGPIVGKVRALIDDRGKQIKTAGPATPVEVLGLTSLPQPGDSFQVADAGKARHIAAFRQTQAKERALAAKSERVTLESLQEKIDSGDTKELPVIVKADVQGSSEVVADTLTKLSDEKVNIRVIHSGVGAINESDVLLASASNAIIIGFNVRPDRNASNVVERENIEIRLHSVIYKITEEIKKAMEGLLDPTFKEVRVGTADVREVFKVPKVGSVAGCLVTDGRITRSENNQARLLRDNVVVYEGKIASLRRFKDDANEVKSGLECGIGLERFNDIKSGDIIEMFTMERIPTTA